MLSPRRLSQILVLPSELVLTVVKRVVNPPPLNLGVAGVARIDQLVRWATRHLFEIVDSAFDRGCAPVGQTRDPASLAQLLQLLPRVARLGMFVATVLPGREDAEVRTPIDGGSAWVATPVQRIAASRTREWVFGSASTPCFLAEADA